MLTKSSRPKSWRYIVASITAALVVLLLSLGLFDYAVSVSAAHRELQTKVSEGLANSLPQGKWLHRRNSPADTPTSTPHYTPVPTVPTATPTPVCGQVWRAMDSPNPSYNQILLGVSALSANNVWAVGYRDGYPSGVEQTLAEHYESNQWSLVSSPNIGAGDNRLTGVAAVSANDVWAVGYYVVGNNVGRTLIEHWDGSQWSVISSPNIGSGDSRFTGIAAVSANNIWVVGHYNNGVDRTLTIRWDGSQWNVVSSPNNGSGSNNLEAVTVVSSNNIWAVGSYRNSEDWDQTLTMRWDGSQWNMISSPNANNLTNILFGVAATSANDVWAVGFYYNSVFLSQTLIEHWDGNQWSVTSSPTLYDDRLYGIVAISNNNALAVGHSSDGSIHRTLVLHWNGSLWSTMHSADIGFGHNELQGVVEVSSNDIWAVGCHHCLGFDLTLIERYNDPCTTPLPTGTPTPFMTATPTSTLTHTTTLTITPISTPTSTRIPTYTATFTSTPAVTPTASPTRQCEAPPNPHAVISNFQYYPEPYMIFVGNTFWSNRDTITHTVTSDTGLWDSGPIAPKDGYFFGPSFAIPGAYPYHCTIHPQMRGIVTVLLPFPTPSATPTPCSSISFMDVHPTDYFYEAVRNLYCSRRAISGYSDNTFRPGNLLTRGQVAKIVVTAMGWPLVCWRTYEWYLDVQPGNPFYWHIYTALDRGIVNGYFDGTFRPNNSNTRAQAAKIVVLAMGWNYKDCPQTGHFSDVLPTNPFFCHIESAYAHGVISGYSDGTFRPGNFVTRGQFSKILYEALRQNPPGE